MLDGRKNVPHDLTVPYLEFNQNDFEAALPDIPKGGVASKRYTQAEAIAAMEANEKKT